MACCLALGCDVLYCFRDVETNSLIFMWFHSIDQKRDSCPWYLPDHIRLFIIQLSCSVEEILPECGETFASDTVVLLHLYQINQNSADPDLGCFVLYHCGVSDQLSHNRAETLFEWSCLSSAECFNDQVEEGGVDQMVRHIRSRYYRLEVSQDR